MNINTQKGNTTVVALVWLVVVVAGVGGWIANIVKLIGFALATDGFAAIGLMEILRIVGVFAAPLGAILGYF